MYATTASFLVLKHWNNDVFQRKKTHCHFSILIRLQLSINISLSWNWETAWFTYLLDSLTRTWINNWIYGERIRLRYYIGVKLLFSITREHSTRSLKWPLLAHFYVNLKHMRFKLMYHMQLDLFSVILISTAYPQSSFYVTCRVFIIYSFRCVIFRLIRLSDHVNRLRNALMHWQKGIRNAYESYKPMQKCFLSILHCWEYDSRISSMRLFNGNNKQDHVPLIDEEEEKCF